MLTVDIVVTPQPAPLQQIAGRVEDTRPLLTLLGEQLEDYERQVFDSQGRGSWSPLDPETVELKGGGRVLVDTGNLLRNLTRAQPVGTDAVQVVQGDAFYGAFLRDGARGMPRRDPAPAPPPAIVAQWADQLLGFITEGRR